MHYSRSTQWPVVKLAVLAVGAVVAYVGLAIPTYWLLAALDFEDFRTAFSYAYTLHLFATLIVVWALVRLLRVPIGQALLVAGLPLAVLAMLLLRWYEG